MGAKVLLVDELQEMASNLAGVDVKLQEKKFLSVELKRKSKLTITEVALLREECATISKKRAVET